MKTDEKTTGRKRGRGIYLLPNRFTVGALFAGFYAIVAATKQYFDMAALAIYVAMLLDALDGRIARLTHSQSEFGAQMDSLSAIGAALVSDRPLKIYRHQICF